jgi:hypothetical protein
VLFSAAPSKRSMFARSFFLSSALREQRCPIIRVFLLYLRFSSMTRTLNSTSVLIFSFYLSEHFNLKTISPRIMDRPWQELFRTFLVIGVHVTLLVDFHCSGEYPLRMG